MLQNQGLKQAGKGVGGRRSAVAYGGRFFFSAVPYVACGRPYYNRGLPEMAERSRSRLWSVPPRFRVRGRPGRLLGVGFQGLCTIVTL